MNIYILLFFTGLIIGLVGQLLLKSGMTKIGEVTLFSKGSKNFFQMMYRMFTNKFVLIGVFLFGCSTLAWIVVISGLELSYIYPMVSLNYVLAAISSKIVFKEQVTKSRWLSIGVIIAGVILVSSS